MKGKKILSVFLSIFVTLSTFALDLNVDASFDIGFELASKGAVMINLDTGDDVIMPKNDDVQMVPASVTKIMTAILALELENNLDKVATITSEAFDPFYSGDPNFYGASAAAIETSQKNITYRDLVYSLMLASACESANILAYNLGGGSIARFVEMMNEKAKEIGATNTNFTNPHGLYEKDNYTTPRDLAKISLYAYEKVPNFMKIVSASEYKMPPNKAYPNGYTIYHTNKLADPTSSEYYEGVSGIKTGSLNVIDVMENGKPTGEQLPGSRTLVTTASKNGYTYMVVTMEAPYDDGTGVNQAFNDHRKLYNWAFGNLQRIQVVEKGEGIETLPVAKGENADVVEAVTDGEIFAILPKSMDKTTVVREINFFNKDLEAPVDKGQRLGIMKLKVGDKEIGEVDLLAKEEVELSVIEDIKERAMAIIDTEWFKGSVIVLFLLISLLLISRNVIKAKKRKQATMKKRRGR